MMNDLYRMKFFLALLVVGIPAIAAYSKGAPAGECSGMTPQHRVEAQKSAAPYDILISKKAIRSGDTVEITIKGKSRENVIKGLMVQARVGDTPVGVFDPAPSTNYVQTLDCGNAKKNALTHKKIESDINEVKFKWTAPRNLAEKVQFYATIAQNGGVFWVKHKSAILTVNK